jgi:hypothetical protein
MWRCPKCRETVQKSFDVCWHCGTSRDGLEDQGFRAEPDDADATKAADAVAPPRTPQYTLRTLLLFVTLIALACAVMHGDLSLLLFTALCVVVANVAGAILAAFVTYGLGIPNDGSLSSDVAPDDAGSDDSNQGAPSGQ